MNIETINLNLNEIIAFSDSVFLVKSHMIHCSHIKTLIAFIAESITASRTDTHAGAQDRAAFALSITVTVGIGIAYHRASR